MWCQCDARQLPVRAASQSRSRKDNETGVSLRSNVLNPGVHYVAHAKTQVQTGEYSPLSAAATGASGAGPVRPSADQIVSTSVPVDSPYRSNKYGVSSDPSAKVSSSPIRRSGRPSPASAIVSATAEPRPPMIE